MGEGGNNRGGGQRGLEVMDEGDEYDDVVANERTKEQTLGLNVAQVSQNKNIND